MQTIRRKSRRIFTAKRRNSHIIPARLKVNDSKYKRIRIDLSKTYFKCVHYLDKKWKTVYMRGVFMKRIYTHTQKKKKVLSFYSQEGDRFFFECSKKNYDIFAKKIQSAIK